MTGQRTPLYDLHLEAGAKMVPFASFEMPLRYGGDRQEHLAVRERAGIFDVSHMGEFLIRGPKAWNLLQYATTNNLKRLEVGKAQYNCMLRPDGGIIDDLIIYQLEDELFMAVVNAANMDKDWAWLNDVNKDFGAELENISAQTALMAISGPKVMEVVPKLTDVPVDEIPFYAFRMGSVAGQERCVIATTGYTGERTFEIYCRAEQAPLIWRSVMEAGQGVGIEPCGLGARDTLRLEAGYHLYGNDMDETTHPYEAGLGWITKAKKGDFIGKEAILAAREAGLTRRLVAFRMQERGIPRPGCSVTDGNGTNIGTVSSGSFSPSLKEGIGNAYVPIELKEPGSRIHIQIRNQEVPAAVEKPPFVPNTSLQQWLGK